MEAGARITAPRDSCRRKRRAAGSSEALNRERYHSHSPTDGPEARRAFPINGARKRDADAPPRGTRNGGIDHCWVVETATENDTF